MIRAYSCTRVTLAKAHSTSILQDVRAQQNALTRLYNLNWGICISQSLTSAFHHGYCGQQSSRYSQSHTVDRSKLNSAQELDVAQFKRWNTRIYRCEYSTKAKRSKKSKWNTQTVEVPVGGNGSVALEIYTHSPDSKRSNVQLATKDTLIYFPSGPICNGAVPEAHRDDIHDILQECEVLLDNSHTSEGQTQLLLPQTVPTVVKVLYRLSGQARSDPSCPDCRFPSPIHDVCLAFDWILNNVAKITPEPTGTEEMGENIPMTSEIEPRILLYGSNIGASLALMLALTQPNDVHAVVVHDPLVDWTGLDELMVFPTNTAYFLPTSKKRNRTNLDEWKLNIQRAATRLIDMRTTLFRTPSGFFDPFASPLLFLRAPGRDTPLWRTARPELEGIPENEVDIVKAMTDEGGIKINENETKEVMSERGYGPYDDDWHVVEPDHDTVDDDSIIQEPSTTTTPNVQQIVTDLSSMSIDKASAESNGKSLPTSSTSLDQLNIKSNSVPQQPLTDLSIVSAAPTTDVTASFVSDISLATSTLPPRRRKVLRRWPSVGRPEDVELPYTKIYSTVPTPNPSKYNEDVDLAYVLHPQAKEMAEVMQRACFWGREKSLGEERVTLEPIYQVGADTGDHQAGPNSRSNSLKSEVARKGIQWLREISRVEK